MVGVVVVDDEALVRSCLQVVLDASEGVEVLACATGVDAAGVVAAVRPAVVLLDVRMPVVDGLAVLPQLVALPEPPAVAMLTSFDADEHVEEALARGASGFLLKDTPPEQLVASVLALAAGAVVLSPGAARALLRRQDAGGAAAQAARAQVAALTARERRCWRCWAGGCRTPRWGGSWGCGRARRRTT
nr:response regulator transcription factor [Quadrisphaera sp. INWT6]